MSVLSVCSHEGAIDMSGRCEHTSIKHQQRVIGLVVLVLILRLALLAQIIIETIEAFVAHAADGLRARVAPRGSVLYE